MSIHLNLNRNCNVKGKNVAIAHAHTALPLSPFLARGRHHSNFPERLWKGACPREVKRAEAVPLCDVDTLLFLGSFQLGSRHFKPLFLRDSRGNLPVVNMAAAGRDPSRGSA